MPPDHAERVADIVEDALDLPTDARAAFIEKICGNDTALRLEVESLLGFRGSAAAFIEEPAFRIDPELLAEPTASLADGTVMGGYRIQSLIGEGGMGEVYLALDVELGRQVALKVIKRGVSTSRLLRQFRREERILAGLTHPNIARLYGAGVTPDGLPFFAMEYVSGERLDEYCELRKLGVTERLELFRKTCAAVSYAHQHLVVHRDLKPANIRVTESGEPKLLDFGIAKLLDDGGAPEPQRTMTVAAVMTPEYASPEQARGEAMTTASDVYSLGVVLYELLSGRKPYHLPTWRPEEISRAITSQVPLRPSSAITARANQTLPAREPIDVRRAKLLRGDLDNIVMMAIRKEPERRYESVAALAEDIRRHTVGLPVIARKDTPGYRTAKFIGRHKAGVLAAALILLTLLGGIVATMRQTRIARLERARAEQRFNDVRKLANSYLFEFHDAIENLPGSTPARALLVRRALEYLDSLAREPGADTSLQREVVMAYVKVGNVQGNPTNSNLGDTAGALESYRKAAAIAEKWVPSASDAQMRRALAIVYQKTADVLAATNRVPKGVQSARRALAIFEELATASPTDVPTVLNVAIEQLKLGDILGNPNFTNLGDSVGAMASYRAASGLLERLYSGGATDPKTRRFLGMIHERIGSLLEVQHDGPGALQAYRRSAEIRLPLAAEFPNDTSFVRDGAVAYEKLSLALAASHDFEAAFENGRKALVLFETLLAADPQNTNAQHSLAVSNIHLGDLLSTAGVPLTARSSAEAIACYRKAIALLEKAGGLDPANDRWHADLAEAQAKLAAFETRQTQ